jgi:hypothetical protein
MRRESIRHSLAAIRDKFALMPLKRKPATAEQLRAELVCLSGFFHYSEAAVLRSLNQRNPCEPESAFRRPVVELPPDRTAAYRNAELRREMQEEHPEFNIAELAAGIDEVPAEVQARWYQERRDRRGANGD